MRLAVILIVTILVIDQGSKIWLINLLQKQGGWIYVLDFFNLVLVWNSGISFGLLQSGEFGRWILVSLSSLVCVALAFWLKRQMNSLPIISLSLVIGGALGNIVDRIWHGAVADFFDFHLLGFHWPAFNIADTAITFGIGFLLYDSFRPVRAKN